MSLSLWTDGGRYCHCCRVGCRSHCHDGCCSHCHGGCCNRCLDDCRSRCHVDYCNHCCDGCHSCGDVRGCSRHDSSGPACRSVSARPRDGSGSGGCGSSPGRQPRARHARHDRWHRRPGVRRRSSRGADSGHRCRSASSRCSSRAGGRNRWRRRRPSTASRAECSSGPCCGAPSRCQTRRRSWLRPSDSRG